MTKRDNEKDSERPHYYSQFWLDVAAGRRIIGTPKPNEEGEQTENELLDVGSPLHAAYASNGLQSNSSPRAAVNGRADGVVPSQEESEPSSDEEYTEPEEDLDLTFADIEDQELPVEETDIPDMDLGAIDGEEEYLDEGEGQSDLEETEELEDTEEIAEEEEDEMNWGRGRKKPKPSRPVKAPTKKPLKRDPRRGAY